MCTKKILYIVQGCYLYAPRPPPTFITAWNSNEYLEKMSGKFQNGDIISKAPNYVSAGWLSHGNDTVLTSTNFIFKMRIVDHVQIKDGRSWKNIIQANPLEFSMRITAKWGIKSLKRTDMLNRYFFTSKKPVSWRTCVNIGSRLKTAK